MGTKKLKILGLGIAGKGEADRYMEIVMKEFARLCDHAIIATNDATDKEKALIDKYGFDQYEDNREWGYHQPHIKTDLLKKSLKYKPDWVVWLDMDEQFCGEVTRETLEQLASGEEIAYNFLIVNLCKDKYHYMHNVGIPRFWNVRFYKVIPELGLDFQEKRLHCGLGPPYAYKFAWHAPYFINHYGLMTEADRARKADRYKKYDPKQVFTNPEYYAYLEKDIKPIQFNRGKLLSQLFNDDSCKPRKVPKPYINPETGKIGEVDKPNSTLITSSGLFRI